MKGKWGYRRLTMLINRHYGYHYNHKRIRRLLIEMNLRAVIRRPRHSCTIARGQNYEPNLLDRNFTAQRLNEKWVTDVTYLPYGNGQKAYLSAIKDLYNGEIISYVVSRRNDNPLVMKTLKQAINQHPTTNLLLHSDRGFQYTSKEFARLTAQYGITRSMSRVGKCIDNAPMESFWSHYKDEGYYGYQFKSYEDLVGSIDQYIYFYNHQRYQEKLNSLTPVEYRHQAA
jgi:putative transposase